MKRMSTKHRRIRPKENWQMGIYFYFLEQGVYAISYLENKLLK